jgi:branched-chain amino acid transport system permease protein
MFYRENGQFKTSYRADQQLLPIVQDRWFMAALLAVAFAVLPFVVSDYLFRALIIPFLILTIAAIGLNILVGYCGQISLGTAAFMAIGAYAAYNLVIRVPGMNFLLAMLLAGFVAALVGVVFGVPSLRIKGLYLAVATLAAQFFIDWLFARVKWFTNYSSSGSVSPAPIDIFGWTIDRPVDKYWFVLGVLVVMTLIAKNLVRSHIGRSWMAIRDMDVAAAVIGIRPLYAKLTAFAVSSFFAGVAGALWGFVHLGAWEPLAFNINLSFNLLFMIIIGGMGSILGSYFGAAFIVVLPLVLNQALPALGGLFGVHVSTAAISHAEAIIFGALIVFFLIVEPHGLARLWAIGKEKLRLWPFPH